MFTAYNLRLIKSYAIYIWVFIIALCILLYLIIIQVPAYFTSREQVNTLKNEVTQLNSKKNIIYSYDASELDSLIKTMNMLLPNSEDYFSIFRSLDIISRRSNFNITSYSVNFSKSNSERLSLQIEAEGSPDGLLSFLNEYKFSGGRLITMDKVNFSPSTTETTFDITFYTKNIPTNVQGNLTDIDKATFNKIKEINSQYNTIFNSNGSNTSDDLYVRKENPFQP